MTPRAFDTWSVLEIAAWLVVGALSYWMGRASRQRTAPHWKQGAQADLDRATWTARKLESTVLSLRQLLANHRAQVDRFNSQLSLVRGDGDNLSSWSALAVLREEAGAILKPTAELAQQLSHAYEQIRRQSKALSTFALRRLDPISGAANQRALEEVLRELLANVTCSGTHVSIALIGVDGLRRDSDRKRSEDHALSQQIADLLQAELSTDDFLGRYGEEFAVVMPGVKRERAAGRAERLCRAASKRLPTSFSAGVADAQAGDSPEKLLSRADAALYSARATGVCRQFVHDGRRIRRYGRRSAAQAAGNVL